MAPDSKQGNMGQKKTHASGSRGRNKKRDMGRSQWAKQKTDKRERNDDQAAAKKRRIDKGEDPLPIHAKQFSKEEIDAEGRKPKRKVAVMIGYSGSGYRGMQMTHDQKTIEGDLFQAFVAAGAISKVNADDPKKSGFVRCARTDKGVHAAGNVISLKLIIEDDDIVQKINDNLSPQIRVWGYERTNNSFSAYQLCDSRVYEYLIPTHSFLPPHPKSFLGQKIVKDAEEKGDLDQVEERQQEVKGFWEAIDDTVIKPILESRDEATRELLMKALYPREEFFEGLEDDDGNRSLEHSAVKQQSKHTDIGSSLGAEAPDPPEQTAEGREVGGQDPPSQPGASIATDPTPSRPGVEQDSTQMETDQASDNQGGGEESNPVAESSIPKVSTNPFRLPENIETLKSIRQAYLAAKRSYRISPERLKRVTDTLALYVGSHKFHNFTVNKGPKDPSASRYIKSFIVNPTPILINGTEWLSLKVHGQSFMMHQIRKMVAMAALIVRCGTDPIRMKESFGEERISIPKAPSLGLLLERPVFDTYNKRALNDFGKETIDFDKYEKEMLDFKQREIYDRIHREEEKENMFGNFFNQIDNISNESFLYLTSGGIPATEKPVGRGKYYVPGEEAGSDVKPPAGHHGGGGGGADIVGVDSDDEDGGVPIGGRRGEGEEG